MTYEAELKSTNAYLCNQYDNLDWEYKIGIRFGCINETYVSCEMNKNSNIIFTLERIN
jgi:hypothetical protein